LGNSDSSSSGDEHLTLLKVGNARWASSGAAIPQDERQVRIHLTEAGRKLRQRAQHIPRRILDATGLDRKEAKRLVEEVCALRKALQGLNLRPQVT
jgi:hypothetical protein